MPFSVERQELERLADLVAALVLRCHRAEREARAASKWDEVLEASDHVAVIVLRNRVMRGDLRSVAEHLIQPQSRVACAMTFLAAVEKYLDEDDVRELRELWKQPAHDKTASLDRLLIRQQAISPTH